MSTTIESEELLRNVSGEMEELEQLESETHRGDTSHRGELLDLTLSSSIISLPELAELCQNNSGTIANELNLTNVSQYSFGGGHNGIERIVGNRKSCNKIKNYVQRQNLIKIHCNAPVQVWGGEAPTVADYRL